MTRSTNKKMHLGVEFHLPIVFHAAAHDQYLLAIFRTHTASDGLLEVRDLFGALSCVGERIEITFAEWGRFGAVGEG